MQRWQMTLFLSATAVLAAALVPQLFSEPESCQLVAVEPVPTPTSSSIPGLSLDAALDNPAVMAGETTERYAVITLKGEAIPGATAEKPVNVAVVMDRSGSMGAQSKMSYAKQAARELVEALEADDRFALVTFSDHAEIPITSAPVLDPNTLMRSIYAVEEGGGTNVYAGLTEGFNQVRANLDPTSLNRVILLSDGNANVGVTSDEQLSQLAGRWMDSGISVSTMGVGLDYNEDLLAEMADQGGGSYRFIDDPTSLAAIFTEELEQLSSVTARGVVASIEPGFGVQVLDVLGYDETVVDGILKVKVGDIRAGETRKVVLKLRVPAGAMGDSLDVLSLAVSTTDGQSAASTVLHADAMGDRALISAHENAAVAVLARQAEANVLAEEATRAYERGDRSRMRALMSASRDTALDGATRYNSDALRLEVERLGDVESALESAPANSNEAVFQVKRAKETYRDGYY